MNPELKQTILNIENEADQLAAIYRHFKVPGRSINNALIDALIWAMENTQQKAISTIGLAYVSDLPISFVNYALKDFVPVEGWEKKPMGIGFDFVRSKSLEDLVDTLRTAGYTATLVMPESYKKEESTMTQTIPTHEIVSMYNDMIALGKPFTRYSVTMALRLKFGMQYNIPHQFVVDYIDQNLDVPADWHEESMMWGNNSAQTFVPGPAPEPEYDDDDDWYDEDEDWDDDDDEYYIEGDEEYDYEGIVKSAFDQLVAKGQPFTRYEVAQLAQSLNPATEIYTSTVRGYIDESSAPEGWDVETRDYNGQSAMTFVPRGYTIEDMRNAVTNAISELCDTIRDFSVNDVVVRVSYKGILVNANAVRKFAENMQLPTGWEFDGEIFIAPAEEEDDFWNIKL